MLPRACHRWNVHQTGAFLALGLSLSAGLAGLSGCFARAVNPPEAEFLVATADSVFWVHSGKWGVHVRAVPMTLAHFDGRFYEVFVADVDRSYDDAIFTGERVYVRDLESGDSTMVYDDTAIITMAKRHARAYPDAALLRPNDDTPTDPEISAAGETDVLEVRGHYALLEHRTDYEMPGGGQHDTVHTAVDLRTGEAATHEAMSRDSVADDSNVVRTVPRSWVRGGYTLNARGVDDGSVSISLRDPAHGTWPLFTVSAHPRVYWLDHPGITAVTRHGLVRAFNAAAAYDDAVKYVKFARPHYLLPVHTSRHA